MSKADKPTADWIAADWIAADWGTTHLRAWAMSASGTELASASSDRGMGSLDREQYEPALLELINPWLSDGRVDVIVCGMLGSRQGWIEAPYSATPCTATASDFTVAPTRDPRISVRVIPGVRQNNPADVMRGEETQIAGFLALNPGWDGIICLPGTHTKWVEVSAGEIVSFQTYITGEMFSLLSKQSILRHSIDQSGWSDPAFLDALSDALAKPEKLAARLFFLRAQSLLTGADGISARSALSGYLIGAELAAARPYWLGQMVAIIGSDALSDTYGKALAAQGLNATITDGERMTLAGLTAAHTRMKELA